MGGRMHPFQCKTCKYNGRAECTASRHLRLCFGLSILGRMVTPIVWRQHSRSVGCRRLRAAVMADNHPTMKPETETDESTSDATTSAAMSDNPYVLSWPAQLFYSAAFVAMIVVAVAGNAVVMWIVVAHRRMRSVTNYFLVNLSLADGLQSVFNTLSNFVYQLHNDWRFGYTWCVFAQFTAPCTISASVFTFIAIAVDRYVTRRCTTARCWNLEVFWMMYGSLIDLDN